MKHMPSLPSLAVLLALAVIALWRPPGALLAQSGGGISTSLSAGYDLTWNTVDGGGATFNVGGGYEVAGSIGQPDAAVWRGGSYALFGGFWPDAAVQYRIYLPLVLRNY